MGKIMRIARGKINGRIVAEQVRLHIQNILKEEEE